MSASASQIQLVHEAELLSPRQSGRRIRAVCHLHGGDHQRSLSIEAAGEYAGYGWCHACQAKVFVPELNPEEAARRARGQGSAPRSRVITPASLLRPVQTATAAIEAGAASPDERQRRELAMLARLEPRMRVRLADARPCAYLAARGIPYEIAEAAGAGYIPADARLAGALAKWRDRLVFPLGSPSGRGYIGRSLWGWRPGMDENSHKALLEALPDAPRRWEKTYPAGWMGYDQLTNAMRVVIVEGVFDALALCAAGVPLEQLVALAGTAAQPDWLPLQVRQVVLALDGDGRGREAFERLAAELVQAGIDVYRCVPPADDGLGKDWSERWRRAEWDGVLPVFDALDLP